MATFTFNGTVLTIVDDNGNVVSQDLQGPEGKIGIRGPQGAPGTAGVDGTVTFESLTEDQIAMLQGPQGLKGDKGDKGDQGIQGVPGADYILTPADRVAIAEEVVTISSDGTIDLNDYYTKAEADLKYTEIQVGIDDRTIVRDGSGNLKTAIGGYWDNGYTVEATGINYVFSGTGIGAYHGVLNDKDYFNMIEAETEYKWKAVFSNGITETGTIKWELFTNDWLYPYEEPPEGGNIIETIYIFQNQADENRNGIYFRINHANYPVLTLTEFYVWIDGVGHCVPIDATYLPIDGTSIVINSDGKLSANGVAGDFVFTEAMKAEIVAEVIASMPKYGGETGVV